MQLHLSKTYWLHACEGHILYTSLLPAHSHSTRNDVVGTPHEFYMRNTSNCMYNDHLTMLIGNSLGKANQLPCLSVRLCNNPFSLARSLPLIAVQVPQMLVNRVH